MQVSDEMVRAALKAYCGPNLYTPEDSMRAALEAAFAALAAEGLIVVPKEITTEIANRTWDSLPSHVQRGLTRPTSHFPGLNVLYRTMIAAAQPLPSPPNISARSSAGSEQPTSNRQVAGSNPAERASSSPQKMEG